MPDLSGCFERDALPQEQSPVMVICLQAVFSEL
jgi:hypothetical protein